MTQNVMSGYYGQQYQQPGDPPRAMDSFMQHDMDSEMAQGMVDITMSGGEGQTLDQIISQNDLELQRRRSNYDPVFQRNGDQQTQPRPSSTVEFASRNNPDPADFQFDPSPSQPSISNQMPNVGAPQKASDQRKIRSRENLAVNTRFNQMNPTFGSISNFSPAMMTNTPLHLDSDSQYLSSNMEIPMSFDTVSGDRAPMNIQPQIEQQALFTASPTHQTFSPIFQSLGQESPAGPGTSMDQSLMDRVSQMRMPESMQNVSAMNRHSTPPQNVMPNTRAPAAPTRTSPIHPPPTSAPAPANLGMKNGPYGNGRKQYIRERSELHR
jgi:hypothetical protein